MRLPSCECSCKGYLAAYADLDTHATATKQARTQVASQLPLARKYYSVLKSAVTNLYGADSPQLAKFGLAPKKPRKPLTSQQLAVRAAKAEATRALRKTTGPVKTLETVSGPMAFVDPTPKAPQWPEQAGVAGTAPSDPQVSAASPPGSQSAGK